MSLITFQDYERVFFSISFYSICLFSSPRGTFAPKHQELQAAEVEVGRVPLYAGRVRRDLQFVFVLACMCTSFMAPFFTFIIIITVKPSILTNILLFNVL